MSDKEMLDFLQSLPWFEWSTDQGPSLATPRGTTVLAYSPDGKDQLRGCIAMAKEAIYDAPPGTFHSPSSLK